MAGGAGQKRLVTPTDGRARGKIRWTIIPHGVASGARATVTAWIAAYSPSSAQRAFSLLLTFSLATGQHRANRGQTPSNQQEVDVSHPSDQPERAVVRRRRHHA